MEIDSFLARVDKVEQISKNTWRCQCPAHEEENTDLVILKGRSGEIIIRCDQGCTTPAILQSLGLSTEDLGLPDSDEPSVTTPSDFQVEIPLIPEEPCEASGARGMIADLLQMTDGPFGLGSVELRRQVSKVVLGDIKDRGKLLRHCEMPCVFLDGRLINLDDRNGEVDWLVSQYDLSPGTRLARGVIRDVRTAVFQDGDDLRVHRASSFDTKSATLRVLLHDGRILSIGPHGVDVVANGTDDIYLQRATWSSPPALLPPLPTPELLIHLVDSIYYVGDNNTRNAQRIALILWLVSAFVGSALRAPPILLLTGKRDSAMSVARVIGQILAGPALSVVRPSTVSELNILLLDTATLALDVGGDVSPTIGKRLVDAVTGSVVAQSRKGRDPTAFRRRHPLLLVTDQPAIWSHRLAEKALRLEVDGEIPFGVVEEMLAGRDRVLGEILGLLSNALNQSQDWAVASYPFELSDLLAKIHVALGGGNEIHGLLQSVIPREERGRFEPVVRILELWLDKDGNRGRWVTTATLQQELASLAGRTSTHFDHPNAQSLAQKIRTLRPLLVRQYRFEETLRRSRKREIRFLAPI